MLESTFNDHSMFMMSRNFDLENTQDISVDDLGKKPRQRNKMFTSNRLGI